MEEQTPEIVFIERQPSVKQQVVGSVIAAGVTILAPIVAYGLVAAAAGTYNGVKKLVEKRRARKALIAQ